MTSLIFMAVLLAVAVLRDWRLWPALAAWSLILFAAVLVPHDARSDFAVDTLPIWLLAAAFALVMAARDYLNAHTRHKAR